MVERLPTIKIGDLALSSDFENYHAALLRVPKKNSERRNQPPASPQSALRLYGENAYFVLKNRLKGCESVQKLQNDKK